MRFASSRIREICEEILELKEEDSDDLENQLKELKEELRVTRLNKKKSFNTWKIITEAEEACQTLVDMAGDVEIDKDVQFVTTIKRSVGSMSSISCDAMSPKRTGSTSISSAGNNKKSKNKLSPKKVNFTSPTRRP